ncbi:CBS domain-containing protein [Kitasatospora sp. NA04385]|uniref:CBS domain-containing protein n=1 Tax=Kitasatospora sp. NA04385 TaxID=2742135 RepID=UPI0015902E61|nr:CBS domain-containing protein [Kitasatospora sp. NA04385]QKW17976.1 CBS domain-containing protein [Kitasatospora sp. NA04385]
MTATERPDLPLRHRRGLTVADAMEPWGHQIADDSTVDRANDVLRGSGAEYLLVRDHDGRCEGVVTRTGLGSAPVRPRRTGHTGRTTVGATAHQRGPFAWPTMGLALAAVAMRVKRLTVWPVVDEEGYPLGVLTADRTAFLLAAPGGADAPSG